eukprot:TRINITY_DN518_c0_g1_i7.p1 TRINITY_DN518_c0_g1~~TRINITY_DN518_c0_g1_i7.p1  ORF type:complete len:875 (+),score=205.08 TRINITY_DN518_c0_g1_i7:94-2718(+)
MGLWVVVFQVLALTCLFQSSRGQSLSVPWATWGGDLFNTRHIQESLIGVQNVARLNRTWQIQSGAVSATPTIASDGLIYVPDFLGFLYCIDSATGAVVFKINIVQMIRNANIVQNPRPWLAYNVSRTSPAIDGDFIYFGTQLSALVACANRFTGAIKWVRQVSTHDVAIITASPVVYNGVLFVGLASNEEHVAGIPSYECCSTIGAFLAYNASTGDLLWRFDTLPPNGGASNLYAGGGVWGSTSPIDPSRNAVYLPTGNTFRNPKHIDDCYANITFVPTHINNWTVDPCLEPNNYAQSIISLDITTGQLKWFKSIGPLMAWSLACGYASNPDLFNPVNCPQEPPGDNADWASAPMFIKGSPYTPQNKDVLVAPQKNGFVWAFDPDNGDPFWVKSMGPGGIFGGSMWGTATDGRVGYFAQSGASGLRYTLPDGTNITRGSWFAMRISDGAILWITPVPFADNLRLQAIGPVTVANGVVYAYVNNPQGTLVAMNAATGAILWKYDTGARGSGGVSIYNGGVFVGAGWVLGSVSQGSINAFSLDGKPLNIATTGSTGSTGSARSTGTSRTTGSSGTAGSSGSSGTVRSLGSSGSTGTSGTVGSIGSTGTTGSSGSSGTVRSLGSSGSTGTSGTVGSIGSTGTAGSSGTSGTVRSLGSSGSTGTSGTVESLGSTGTAGSSGSTGTARSLGTSGSTGSSGTVGSTGSSGSQVSTGAVASTGPTGTSGTAGATGSQSSTTTTGTTASNGMGTSGIVGSTDSARTTGEPGTVGSSGISGSTTTSGTSGSRGTGSSGTTGAPGTTAAATSAASGEANNAQAEKSGIDKVADDWNVSSAGAAGIIAAIVIAGVLVVSIATFFIVKHIIASRELTFAEQAKPAV